MASQQPSREGFLTILALPVEYVCSAVTLPVGHFTPGIVGQEDTVVLPM